jgi:hypothetical protein
VLGELGGPVGLGDADGAELLEGHFRSP